MDITKRVILVAEIDLGLYFEDPEGEPINRDPDHWRRIFEAQTVRAPGVKIRGVDVKVE